ncbi:NMDA receptor-regulated protein 1-domain-containing protein [Lineolata rhizophorae]|uniref:NMDA receptor-regulated protein 1-domain-containing protein n=1 Tax=Lineolata rhizophorae TaxID=578093 RepID=A0A6A6PBY8_9PEZI|nr:NMDA receptor-regulated protein 1-domain-containing protein [Lineolata rhizophorae]
MPQQLSSKDLSLFRQLHKYYDSKQYKKGLRNADQILRRNPNHGDTQAMKALILNAMGQTDEAFALAKEALKHDMKSHICWHVYGLLYRSVKNFEEAIKAYKFALRLQPDNGNIQRDLALLQMQMRDYAGYLQSRRAMLQARPGLRQNWTAMAVAHHLSGDLAAAEKVLTTFEETLTKPPPKSDLEHAEAMLYKNTIIAESGDTRRALDHLESIMRNQLDRTAVMEMRAKYLLSLGRMEDAEAAYRELLDRNNEYRAYYEALEKCLSLERSNQEHRERLTALYDEYAKSSERVDAARRIPLDFLEGEEFKTAADPYLRRMLRKGVPSTFANVKALYSDASKKQTIEELVEGYSSELPMNGSAEKQPNGDHSDSFQQAVLFFLAQHYNYYLSRNLPKAMEFTDKALERNPESVDYNMTKARIWKHYGDLQKASETMNHARSLDEKDRYINSKCAKYQLRNHQNEDALKTMSKFTKNDTVGGPLGDLHDMQCLWYITEDGLSYARQGKYGLALKRFKAIYDMFDVWQEDQFDFHSYSIRKGQVRAYVDMVRWEDRLREHPFYARIAIPAAKIYVQLFDKPSLASGLNGPIPDYDKMDASERRKAMKKAKREQEKQEKAEAERREAEKKNAAKKPVGPDGEPKKEDPDPQGKQLLATKEPLGEATKYVEPLLEFAPRNIEGQNVGFEVFIRRKKYLRGLKCLLQTASVDPENPTLHEQTIRLRKSLDSLPEPLSPKVSEVVKSSFTLIPDNVSLSDFNESYISKHAGSAAHIRGGLDARQSLDSNTQKKNEEELIGTLQFSGVDIQDGLDGLALLKSWGADEATVSKYDEAARKRWPEATFFETS